MQHPILGNDQADMKTVVFDPKQRDIADPSGTIADGPRTRVDQFPSRARDPPTGLIGAPFQRGHRETEPIAVDEAHQAPAVDAIPRTTSVLERQADVVANPRWRVVSKIH